MYIQETNYNICSSYIIIVNNDNASFYIQGVSSSLMFYTIHVLLCLVSFQKVYILPNGGQQKFQGEGDPKAGNFSAGVKEGVGFQCRFARRL